MPEPLSVLVVEDDFRVAELHAAAVDAVEGLRVVGRAGTAADALEAAARLRPRLVLLDRHLPDRDGLEVLGALRRSADGAAPPAVLVISGDRSGATVVASARLGAGAHLLKPVDFDDLRRRLVAWVALERRRDAAATADGELDQTAVDALLDTAPGGPAGASDGATAPTTRRVRDALRAADGALSAADVAEVAGVSRATAQRHLTTLTRIGQAELELRYGGAGRPEHRYRATA